MSTNFPRVGSALLVRDEANRILLGQRNKDPQRGSWIIPGGKIHAFESIADAAARELAEETGLEVEVTGHFRVYEIVKPPDEHRIVIYSWGRVLNEAQPKASDDLSDVRFFSVDELGSVPLTPLVKQVLSDAGLFPMKPMSEFPRQLELLSIPLAGASLDTLHRATSRKRRRSSGSYARTSRLSFDRDRSTSL